MCAKHYKWNCKIVQGFIKVPNCALVELSSTQSKQIRLFAIALSSMRCRQSCWHSSVDSCDGKWQRNQREELGKVYVGKWLTHLCRKKKKTLNVGKLFHMRSNITLLLILIFILISIFNSAPRVKQPHKMNHPKHLQKVAYLALCLQPSAKTLSIWLFAKNNLWFVANSMFCESQSKSYATRQLDKNDMTTT